MSSFQSPCRRALLLVLTVLLALPAGQLGHQDHHGTGLGAGHGAPELHDGSCDHLPALHAEGPHECLACQSGSDWLLVGEDQDLRRLAAGPGSRVMSTGTDRSPARVGPPLGPRGPPTIG